MLRVRILWFCRVCVVLKQKMNEMNELENQSNDFFLFFALLFHPRAQILSS